MSTPTPDLVRFVLRLRRLSQGQLARVLEVRPGTVRSWLRGAEPRPWSLRSLQALADGNGPLLEKAARVRGETRTGRPPGVSEERRREARDLLGRIAVRSPWAWKDLPRKVAPLVGVDPRTVLAWMRGACAPQEVTLAKLRTLAAGLLGTRGGAGV